MAGDLNDSRLLLGHDVLDPRRPYSPRSGAVVVMAPPESDRARAIEGRVNLDDCTVVVVATADSTVVRLVDRGDPGGSNARSVDLRDSDMLLNVLSGPEVVVDISCLDFAVWGPLINTLLNAGADVRVVYTEASFYGQPSLTEGLTTLGGSWSPNPGPVPSMVRLSRAAGGDSVLVALVGFEGLRLQALISALDPSDTVPILGVPGIEHDYPFLALDGNRLVILSLVDPTSLLMADAISPFDVALVLSSYRRTDERYIHLAPVGTQPHALGALLFWRHDRNCQLLYDFPNRSSSYASGAGPSHLYDVSRFDADFAPRTEADA